MSFIRTIHEDIDPENLGFTYSHEHLICRPMYWIEKGNDDLILDSVEKTSKDVLEYLALGGKSIVDATAIDYGRDMAAVSEISRLTGVKIVATAGFNKGLLWSSKLTKELQNIIGSFPTYKEWIEKTSIEILAEHVAGEVENGMEGTKCRAGQVKFGTGYNSISPLEEKTIRAVAMAHHKTKAPIHSHTEAGTMALEQIDILKEENVDLSNVSFGHMDRNLDLYYYEKILDTGAFLCFDGMGKIKYAPESARIEAIIELCKRGHSKRILVSHDMARKSYYRHYNHGIGLSFIKEKWIPRFVDQAMAAGLDDNELINAFFVDNPRICFTFKHGSGDRNETL